MNAISVRNLVLSAYVAVATAVSTVQDRFVRAQDEGDRGDNNISTIMWIVGIVTFAALAIAAFTTLGNSKLDQIKGL